jgi:hypothetical protein
MDAKHIVTNAYIEAITRATALGPDETSVLEEDFDAHWPDAMEYVPPPGKEPNPRDHTHFAPDLKRQDIFAGFCFVFFDRHQFEQLGDIVNNGSGKAHFYELVAGKSTASDFVGYVKKLQAKRLVIVRFPRTEASERWTIDFVHDVELALGQRAMEQNEFLGAILDLDPAALMKPLEEETVSQSAATRPGREQTNPGRYYLHH